MKVTASFVSVLLTVATIADSQNLPNARGTRTDVYYARGIEFLKQDKIFEAGSEFQRVIDLNPEHNDALYQLAMVQERLGDSSSAIRFLVRAMKLNDKRASRELASRYGFQLSYADTMQNIDASTREKYRSLSPIQASSMSDLASAFMTIAKGKREQLQLFLLWAFEHMQADSIRFFHGGTPLSTDEAFARRIGLCDEYAALMDEFCKAVAIPTFRIPGYVKYPGFKAGDTFNEANHAWNTVYVDSSWLLCDVFWSTVALTTDDALGSRFTKRLEPNYFLSVAPDFINDHLPADPVFQFSNYPIAVTSFTSKVEGIDTSVPKMSYLNYEDSLKSLGAMSERDYGLKVAYHSFVYNKDNANDFIVASYNYAVDVLADNTSSTLQWQVAQKGLALSMTIIDASPNEEIRALKTSCKTALSMLEKRLGRK